MKRRHIPSGADWQSHGETTASRIPAMKRITFITLIALLLAPLAAPHAALAPVVFGTPGNTARAVNLEEEFRHPSTDSKVGVFWFWANTVSREGIRRDLEAMKRAGIGRVVLGMTRAHTATVETGGVVFLSPEWLALFRYALDEAARLGIKVSAVMSNGWYQGGPWVTPELGAQMLVWSETIIGGPKSFAEALPEPNRCRSGRRARIPPTAKGHFKPVATLAFRENTAGELIPESLVRLDDKVGADGKLTWSVPKGKWNVFRFAQAPNFMAMKQDSPGYTGLQIDHLSARAMELLFEKIGLPLLAAAGPHVGKTLDYFHEDSIELGHYDWTGDFPAQFQARRGYDLLPWLPVLAGKRFAGQPEAGGVEPDFLATGDALLADEHYGRFLELCHRHGIKLETEGGEVRGSIRVKGKTDLPMGEFWNFRPTPADGRFVKNSDYLRAFNPNTIFASHVYGQNRSAFEAFTTPQHWMEYPAMLKPMADEVFCLGASVLTLHGYSYSRPETAAPGDVYFAGTHFNPGVTWWKQADKFFAYLNRCQVLLTAGLPVTDMIYVDGPETQDMAQQNEALKETALGKYDVIPGDLLVARLKVLPDGRVGLPHGAAYAVLAVANATIEPETLRKIVQLANDGATVWLRAVPRKAAGWKDYPQATATVAEALEQLDTNRPAGIYPVGKGRVMLGNLPVKDMFARAGLHSDFAYTPQDGKPFLNYTHRRTGDADIYFVANWTEAWRRAECVFRVNGKQPELWNPVTGDIAPCPLYRCGQGVTRLPLRLAPHGSVFVVFRKEAAGVRIESLARNGKNLEDAGQSPGEDVAELVGQAAGPVCLEAWKAGNYTMRDAAGGLKRIEIKELPAPRDVTGPWRIRFVPARETLPAFEITEPKLFLWNESADDRIKSFAGAASYQREVVVDKDWLEGDRRVFLDLGEVHDLAEVAVNGKPVGTVWTHPFQMEITAALTPGKNVLEIRVINTWHNWRIATRYMPVQHPWAARGLKSPLMPAGLVGPVTLRTAMKRTVE